MPKACAACHFPGNCSVGRAPARTSYPVFLVVTFVLLLGFLGAARGASNADAAVNRFVAATANLFEGDILVAHNPYARSISVAGTVQSWTDGIVPYIIDSEMPEQSVTAIEEAVVHWNEVAGISLQPVTANQITDGEAVDRLRFTMGNGCASWVGRRGGEQAVWVAANCTTGSILHEIGHALGLEHEHTRPDRDNYIIIHWDNITDDRIHNFDVAPSGSRLLGRYDYDSIMHYGPNNFSKDGKPTITPRSGSADAIGQRTTPSAGDLSAINVLYATDLSVITRVHENATAREVSVSVANEHRQGAHNIAVNISVDEGVLRPLVNNGWRCNDPVQSQLICELDRLAAGDRTELLLSLSNAVDVGSLEARVSSKSPDINLDNNSNVADFPASASNVPSNAEESPVLGAAVGVQEDPVVLNAAGGSVSIVWLLLGVPGLWRSLCNGFFGSGCLQVKPFTAA